MVIYATRKIITGSILTGRCENIENQSECMFLACFQHVFKSKRELKLYPSLIVGYDETFTSNYQTDYDINDELIFYHCNLKGLVPMMTHRHGQQSAQLYQQ